MNNTSLCAIVALCGITPASAAQVIFGQTFGGTIPDATVSFMPGTPLISTIHIADPGIVVALNTVGFTNFSHDWAGDLLVVLTAPNGDNVQIFGRLGCTANNTFGNDHGLGDPYAFRNTGAPFGGVSGTLALHNGTYARRSVPAALTNPAPDNDDFTVFNGDPVTGDWTLTITDWAPQETGSLFAWSLNISVLGPCTADIINTGTSANQVDVDDLLAVIEQWGPCPALPTECPANVFDVSGASDNTVDVDDLLKVIVAWGPCT